MDTAVDWEGAGCAEQCPQLLHAALDVLSAKWAIPIYLTLHLADEPLRYAQLQRSLGGITPKELAKQLRKFEERGLIVRTIIPTSPPAVFYALSERGTALYSAVRALAAWSAENRPPAPIRVGMGS